MKQDVYERITAKIVADLEQGVRTWLKPWNAEHAAGRITRPLRANGIPYRGINIIMLWMEAMEKGFAAPIWMTFKQALQLSMQPEHRLKPAVEKALEWAREQERVLTERQREVFNALRHRQAKERELKEKRLDSIRAELRERDKNRKAKPELTLKPPVIRLFLQLKRERSEPCANERPAQ